jgi:excisionase family DNA binding protein
MSSSKSSKSAYISLSAVAEYLDISYPSVWRLVKSGSLKACRFGGEMWRVKKVDLEEWELAEADATAAEIAKHQEIQRAQQKKRPVGRPRKAGVKPAAAQQHL